MFNILRDYQMEKNVAASCGEGHLSFIEYVWYSVRNWMVTERCKRSGHEFRVVTCDPENGYETLECSRCGEQWEAFY